MNDVTYKTIDEFDGDIDALCEEFQEMREYIKKQEFTVKIMEMRNKMNSDLLNLYKKYL